jgi:hypothetical protein
MLTGIFPVGCHPKGKGERNASGRIRPEPLLSIKQQLGYQHQKYTDASCTQYFTDEIKKTAKLQPLQENEIYMMYEGKNHHICSIWGISHTFYCRLPVVQISPFLCNQQIDKPGSNVRDQCTGRRVQSGGFCEIIERKAKKETQEYKLHTGRTKRQPYNIQKVQIGNNELVQRLYLEKDEDLNQDKKNKTDRIFYEVIH